MIFEPHSTLLYPSNYDARQQILSLPLIQKSNAIATANAFMNSILSKSPQEVKQLVTNFHQVTNMDGPSIETFTREMLEHVSPEFKKFPDWSEATQDAKILKAKTQQKIADLLRPELLSPQAAALQAVKDQAKKLDVPFVSASLTPLAVASSILTGKMVSDEAFKAAPKMTKEVKTGGKLAATALEDGYVHTKNSIANWWHNDVLGPEAGKRTTRFMDALSQPFESLTALPPSKHATTIPMYTNPKVPHAFIKWPRNVVAFSGGPKQAEILTTYILKRLRDPLFTGAIRAALSYQNIPITPYAVAAIASLGIKEGGTRTVQNEKSTATGYFQLTNDTALEQQNQLARATDALKLRLADSLDPYFPERAQLVLKGKVINPDSTIRKRPKGVPYSQATWVLAVQSDPTNQIIPNVMFLGSLLKRVLSMATWANGTWSYNGRRNDIRVILDQNWCKNDYYAGLSVLLAVFHTNGINIDMDPGTPLAHVNPGDSNSRVYMVSPFVSKAACDYQIMCYILASPTCYSLL